jgi:hypothetical protein
MAYQMIGTGLGGTPQYVNRADPALPVNLMQTYEMRFPTTTHFRVASCVEVECEWYHGGRLLGFDLTDPAKREAAQQIGSLATKMGLRFAIEQVGTTVQFKFPPGQSCLQGHKVPLERDPLYLRWKGDWRGQQGGIYRHTNGADFAEDWQENVDKVITRSERG